MLYKQRCPFSIPLRDVFECVGMKYTVGRASAGVPDIAIFPPRQIDGFVNMPDMAMRIDALYRSYLLKRPQTVRAADMEINSHHAYDRCPTSIGMLPKLSSACENRPMAITAENVGNFEQRWVSFQWAFPRFLRTTKDNIKINPFIFETTLFNLTFKQVVLVEARIFVVPVIGRRGQGRTPGWVG